MTGLLIAGELVPVPGVNVIPPATHGGPPWATLSPGDYRMRPTAWIRQVILHTTKGQAPQHVIPGAGAPGRAEIVADFWRHDPAHSAAPLVMDVDGTAVCLGDLVELECYHAEGSNPWSVGIEMYQLGDGGLYDATLASTARLVEVLCEHFGIPTQYPRPPYRGVPLSRMETGSGPTRRQLGGPNLVGVFGHRDNTSNRGPGDPGDEIFRRLAALGFEAVNFEHDEDLLLGKERQAALNARGARLTVDGVVGVASIGAMRQLGFKRWRDVA